MSMGRHKLSYNITTDNATSRLNWPKGRCSEKERLREENNFPGFISFFVMNIIGWLNETAELKKNMGFLI